MRTLCWIGGDEPSLPEADRSHEVEADLADDEEEPEELEPREPRPVVTAQVNVEDNITRHPQLSGTSERPCVLVAHCVIISTNCV